MDLSLDDLIYGGGDNDDTVNDDDNDDINNNDKTNNNIKNDNKNKKKTRKKKKKRSDDDHDDDGNIDMLNLLGIKTSSGSKGNNYNKESNDDDEYSILFNSNDKTRKQTKKNSKRKLGGDHASEDDDPQKQKRKKKVRGGGRRAPELIKGIDDQIVDGIVYHTTKNNKNNISGVFQQEKQPDGRYNLLLDDLAIDGDDDDDDFDLGLMDNSTRRKTTRKNENAMSSNAISDRLDLLLASSIEKYSTSSTDLATIVTNDSSTAAGHDDNDSNEMRQRGDDDDDKKKKKKKKDDMKTMSKATTPTSTTETTPVAVDKILHPSYYHIQESLSAELQRQNEIYKKHKTKMEGFISNIEKQIKVRIQEVRHQHRKRKLNRLNNKNNNQQEDQEEQEDEKEDVADEDIANIIRETTKPASEAAVGKDDVVDTDNFDDLYHCVRHMKEKVRDKEYNYIRSRWMKRKVSLTNEIDHNNAMYNNIKNQHERHMHNEKRAVKTAKKTIRKIIKDKISQKDNERKKRKRGEPSEEDGEDNDNDNEENGENDNDYDYDDNNKSTTYGSGKDDDDAKADADVHADPKPTSTLESEGCGRQRWKKRQKLATGDDDSSALLSSSSPSPSSSSPPPPSSSSAFELKLRDVIDHAIERMKERTRNERRKSKRIREQYALHTKAFWDDMMNKNNKNKNNNGASAGLDDYDDDDDDFDIIGNSKGRAKKEEEEDIIDDDEDASDEDDVDEDDINDELELLLRRSETIQKEERIQFQNEERRRRRGNNLDVERVRDVLVQRYMDLRISHTERIMKLAKDKEKEIMNKNLTSQGDNDDVDNVNNIDHVELLKNSDWYRLGYKIPSFGRREDRIRRLHDDILSSMIQAMKEEEQEQQQQLELDNDDDDDKNDIEEEKEDNNSNKFQSGELQEKDDNNSDGLATTSSTTKNKKKMVRWKLDDEGLGDDIGEYKDNDNGADESGTTKSWTSWASNDTDTRKKAERLCITPNNFHRDRDDHYQSSQLSTKTTTKLTGSYKRATIFKYDTCRNNIMSYLSNRSYHKHCGYSTNTANAKCYFDNSIYSCNKMSTIVQPLRFQLYYNTYYPYNIHYQCHNVLSCNVSDDNNNNNYDHHIQLSSGGGGTITSSSATSSTSLGGSGHGTSSISNGIYRECYVYVHSKNILRIAARYMYNNNTMPATTTAAASRVGSSSSHSGSIRGSIVRGRGHKSSRRRNNSDNDGSGVEHEYDERLRENGIRSIMSSSSSFSASAATPPSASSRGSESMYDNNNKNNMSNNNNNKLQQHHHNNQKLIVEQNQDRFTRILYNNTLCLARRQQLHIYRTVLYGTRLRCFLSNRWRDDTDNDNSKATFGTVDHTMIATKMLGQTHDTQDVGPYHEHNASLMIMKPLFHRGRHGKPYYSNSEDNEDDNDEDEDDDESSGIILGDGTRKRKRPGTTTIKQAWTNGDKDNEDTDDNDAFESMMRHMKSKRSSNNNKNYYSNYCNKKHWADRHRYCSLRIRGSDGRYQQGVVLRFGYNNNYVNNNNNNDNIKKKKNNENNGEKSGGSDNNSSISMNSVISSSSTGGSTVVTDDKEQSEETQEEQQNENDHTATMEKDDDDEEDTAMTKTTTSGLFKGSGSGSDRGGSDDPSTTTTTDDGSIIMHTTTVMRETSDSGHPSLPEGHETRKHKRYNVPEVCRLCLPIHPSKYVFVPGTIPPSLINRRHRRRVTATAINNHATVLTSHYDDNKEHLQIMFGQPDKNFFVSPQNNVGNIDETSMILTTSSLLCRYYNNSIDNAATATTSTTSGHDDDHHGAGGMTIDVLMRQRDDNGEESMSQRDDDDRDHSSIVSTIKSGRNNDEDSHNDGHSSMVQDDGDDKNEVDVVAPLTSSLASSPQVMLKKLSSALRAAIQMNHNRQYKMLRIRTHYRTMEVAIPSLYRSFLYYLTIILNSPTAGSSSSGADGSMLDSGLGGVGASILDYSRRRGIDDDNDDDDDVYRNLLEYDEYDDQVDAVGSALGKKGGSNNDDDATSVSTRTTEENGHDRHLSVTITEGFMYSLKDLFCHPSLQFFPRLHVVNGLLNLASAFHVGGSITSRTTTGTNKIQDILSRPYDDIRYRTPFDIIRNVVECIMQWSSTNDMAMETTTTTMRIVFDDKSGSGRGVLHWNDILKAFDVSTKCFHRSVERDPTDIEHQCWHVASSAACLVLMSETIARRQRNGEGDDDGLQAITTSSTASSQDDGNDVDVNTVNHHTSMHELQARYDTILDDLRNGFRILVRYVHKQHGIMSSHEDFEHKPKNATSSVASPARGHLAIMSFLEWKRLMMSMLMFVVANENRGGFDCNGSIESSITGMPAFTSTTTSLLRDIDRMHHEHAISWAKQEKTRLSYEYIHRKLKQQQQQHLRYHTNDNDADVSSQSRSSISNEEETIKDKEEDPAEKENEKKDHVAKKWELHDDDKMNEDEHNEANDDGSGPLDANGSVISEIGSRDDTEVDADERHQQQQQQHIIEAMAARVENDPSRICFWRDLVGALGPLAGSLYKPSFSMTGCSKCRGFIRRNGDNDRSGGLAGDNVSDDDKRVEECGGGSGLLWWWGSSRRRMWMEHVLGIVADSENVGDDIFCGRMKRWGGGQHLHRKRNNSHHICHNCNLDGILQSQHHFFCAEHRYGGGHDGGRPLQDDVLAPTIRDIIGAVAVDGGLFGTASSQGRETEGEVGHSGSSQQQQQPNEVISVSDSSSVSSSSSLSQRKKTGKKATEDVVSVSSSSTKRSSSSSHPSLLSVWSSKRKRTGKNENSGVVDITNIDGGANNATGKASIGGSHHYHCQRLKEDDDHGMYDLRWFETIIEKVRELRSATLRDVGMVDDEDDGLDRLSQQLPRTFEEIMHMSDDDHRRDDNDDQVDATSASGVLPGSVVSGSSSSHPVSSSGSSISTTSVQGDDDEGEHEVVVVDGSKQLKHQHHDDGHNQEQPTDDDDENQQHQKKPPLTMMMMGRRGDIVMEDDRSSMRLSYRYNKKNLHDAKAFELICYKIVVAGHLCGICKHSLWINRMIMRLLLSCYRGGDGSSLSSYSTQQVGRNFHNKNSDCSCYRLLCRPKQQFRRRRRRQNEEEADASLLSSPSSATSSWIIFDKNTPAYDALYFLHHRVGIDVYRCLATLTTKNNAPRKNKRTLHEKRKKRHRSASSCKGALSKRRRRD